MVGSSRSESGQEHGLRPWGPRVFFSDRLRVAVTTEEYISCTARRTHSERHSCCCKQTGGLQTRNRSTTSRESRAETSCSV